MTNSRADRPTEQQQLELLQAVYKYWFLMIPWEVPALLAFKREYQEQQDYGTTGADGHLRLYPINNYRNSLISKTTKLLMRAGKDIPKDTNAQPSNLAALYEVRRNYADAFRHYESGSGGVTMGFPFEDLEKDVLQKVRAWINDNIQYLESMGVLPQRAGSVEVKQTAKICALVYILDKKATGQDIPGKTALEKDITSNYPQFKRAANSIYKETGMMSGNPTKQDCRQYAGKEWRQVVLSLSSHTDQLKQYIENGMIEK